MSTSKHYPKAPIIEAVLHLQVLPSENFKKSFYDSFKKEVADKFRGSDIKEMSMEFHFEEEEKRNSHTEKKVGMRFEGTDGRYVIQARENGYAFSILNYYDCWESFSKEAYKYWNVYKGVFKPQKVTRQALRYINRIDIPEAKFKLEDYFKVYPRIFDDDSEVDVAGFFMQAQIPQQEGGIANITQTIAAPVKAGCTSVILDIDVFDNKHFKPNSKDLKPRIETFRNQKNAIFESAITSRTKELIS